MNWRPIYLSIWGLIMIASAQHALAREVAIVGGGHLGLIHAQREFVDAKKRNEDIIVNVFEKNAEITETTAANIFNSHTPDEIVAVIDRGKDLEKAARTPFYEPSGIWVNDDRVNASAATQRFMSAVKLDSENQCLYEGRHAALLKLGKASMTMWKQFYDNSYGSMRSMMDSCNFHPCYDGEERGYRIDLIYGDDNAENKARRMMSTYVDLGYPRCKLLSPDEVLDRDPTLAKFVAVHATGLPGNRSWNSSSMAILRPGGCLDTQQFIPKFAEQLKQSSGKSIDGTDRFRLHLSKKVTGVITEDVDGGVVIRGLRFADGSEYVPEHKDVEYIFAPGESVGTLTSLGFAEPAYAGFAGASLRLEIPLTEELLAKYANFSQFMEVHKVGVVLAWQARIRDGKIFLGAAGTKAFYGDVEPTIDDDFARERNLLQLNMFNEVMPDLISLAMKEDTMGRVLTYNDMDRLVSEGFLYRWVGRRALAYCGFPTVGAMYFDNKKVLNSQVTTHLGSGGGSFSFIMSLISTYAVYPERAREELHALGLDEQFLNEVIRYGDSRREPACVN